MKNLCIDLLLVFLCFFFIVKTFDPIVVEQRNLSSHIDQFEQSIQQEEVQSPIEPTTGIIQDNKISLVMRNISAFCIKIIELIAIIITNFIGILL